MTLYEKILSVMASVEYLKKDDFVETGAGKGYKALTDEKVLTAIRPALVSAGLIMLPIKVDQTRTDETVNAFDSKGRPIERINRVTSVKAVYRIINVENPQEFVDIESAGTGVDTQDKGVGKAMTYAKKYAILNSFLIPSGEDTDQISSDKYTEQLVGKPSDTAIGFTPNPPAEPKTDRKINVAACIELAKGTRYEQECNDKGYRGKPWDELEDDQIVKIKLFFVNLGKTK